MGSTDWERVSRRDAERRKRVRQMIDQGEARTGKDFERAAMVFQHGDTSDDILFAHVLAVTAIGKGNPGARWLAAASPDRYLHRIGQPQIYGTQFTIKDREMKRGTGHENTNRRSGAHCSERK